MAPTSDERREVARRLRTEVSEGECIDYAVFRIVHDVMGVEDATGARAGRILADLMDPTCHEVSCITYDYGMREETLYEHELSCGHTFDTFSPEPPCRCGVCGARVVRDDD